MGNMDRMDEVSYRDDKVPENILEAAMAAACACGYDSDAERLLWADVLSVGLASAEDVMPLYPEVFTAGDECDPGEFARITWQTWAIPTHFEGEYESAIVERVESILVDVATLMSREVLTYGLGREHNWLEWADRGCTGKSPPDDALGVLTDLITGEWSPYIREWAEDEPDYLNNIHPTLRGAAAKSCQKG
jgi:hypothetical protein